MRVPSSSASVGARSFCAPEETTFLGTPSKPGWGRSPMPATSGIESTITLALTAALPPGVRFTVQPKALPGRYVRVIGEGFQLHWVPVVGRVVTATSGLQPLFANDYSHYVAAITRALGSTGGMVQTPKSGGWVVWVPVGAPEPTGEWPRKRRKPAVYATPSEEAEVAPPPDEGAVADALGRSDSALNPKIIHPKS